LDLLKVHNLSKDHDPEPFPVGTIICPLPPNLRVRVELREIEDGITMNLIRLRQLVYRVYCSPSNSIFGRVDIFPRLIRSQCARSIMIQAYRDFVHLVETSFTKGETTVLFFKALKHGRTETREWKIAEEILGKSPGRRFGVYIISEGFLVVTMSRRNGSISTCYWFRF
jgi:hypothetical protein